MTTKMASPVFTHKASMLKSPIGPCKPSDVAIVAESRAALTTGDAYAASASLMYHSTQDALFHSTQQAFMRDKQRLDDHFQFEVLQPQLVHQLYEEEKLRLETQAMTYELVQNLQRHGAVVSHHHGDHHGVPVTSVPADDIQPVITSSVFIQPHDSVHGAFQAHKSYEQSTPAAIVRNLQRHGATVTYVNGSWNGSDSEMRGVSDTMPKSPSPAEITSVLQNLERHGASISFSRPADADVTSVMLPPPHASAHALPILSDADLPNSIRVALEKRLEEIQVEKEELSKKKSARAGLSAESFAYEAVLVPGLHATAQSKSDLEHASARILMEVFGELEADALELASTMEEIDHKELAEKYQARKLKAEKKDKADALYESARSALADVALQKNSERQNNNNNASFEFQHGATFEHQHAGLPAESCSSSMETVTVSAPPSIEVLMSASPSIEVTLLVPETAPLSPVPIPLSSASPLSSSEPLLAGLPTRGTDKWLADLRRERAEQCAEQCTDKWPINGWLNAKRQHAEMEQRQAIALEAEMRRTAERQAAARRLEDERHATTEKRNAEAAERLQRRAMESENLIQALLTRHDNDWHVGRHA